MSHDRAAPIPALSLLFGYGPMAVLMAFGIGSWTLPAPWSGLALAGGWLFGTAILLFLAGVTRGLSFFSPGGPQPVQFVIMLWLFLLGFGSLAGSLARPLWIGCALLVLGYGTIAIYDPQAARRGFAPAYFARLRPPQMGIAVAACLLLLMRALLV